MSINMCLMTKYNMLGGELDSSSGEQDVLGGELQYTGLRASIF